MAGTVIEEFLLALGFTVSRQSLNEFNGALRSAHGGFSLLAKAAEVAAAAVEFSIGKISNSLDKLYFQAERTKASAESLVAFSYAAKQTGVSAESAANAVENLASKLRRSPGMAQFVANLGGTSSDPAKMIEQLQKRLSSLPMFLQLQYADMFGVDEKTWLALGKQGPFREEQARVAKAMGLNISAATKAANGLWTALRSTAMVLENIGMLINQRLAGSLGEQLKRIRDYLIDNAGGIAKGVEYLTIGIVKGIEVLIRLGATAAHALSDLWAWFNKLDAGSQRWIEIILGIAAAFRVLDIAMALNPFGLWIAAITALLLLLDDFYTYQKTGGKKTATLIDWGAVSGMIDNFKHALSEAGDYVKQHWQWLLDLLGDTNGKGFDGGIANKMELMLRSFGLSSRTDAPGDNPGTNNALTNSRVASVTDILSKEGRLKPEQIAGILGNLSAENAGFNPQLTNESGHVGLAQWDKSAQAQYAALHNGATLSSASVEDQARFLLWELNNTEKQVGNEVRGSNTIEQAGLAYLHRERPFNESDPRFAETLKTRIGKGQFWYHSKAMNGANTYTPSNPGTPDTIPRYNPNIPDSMIHTPGSYDAPVSSAPTIRLHAPTIHQTNNYSIKSTDPKGAATEIHLMQESDNRMLLRNTKGALV